MRLRPNGEPMVITVGDNLPKNKPEEQKKQPVRTAPEFYTAPAGKREEALQAIICEELAGVGRKAFPEEIWLDINTGEIEVTRVTPAIEYSGSMAGYADGYDGKILLWTRTENRPISDLRNALIATQEAPFEGLNFIEWYLNNNFMDRINWTL